MAEKRRVRVDTGEPVARPDFSGDAPVLDEAPQMPSSDAVCGCPRLERDEWHEVQNDWSDITFVKTSIPAAMGVPVGYNKVYAELVSRASKVGATVPDDAMLLLGEGKFRRPVMLEVEDVPADAKGIERPGGVAFTRIAPAAPGAVKGVVEETIKAATDRVGRKPDETWLWYLTCRTCSGERDFETLVVAHYR
jgi:hypothetical protein